MHSFQPFPISDIEINPFHTLSRDWAALVTEANQKTNAMTVSWGGFGVNWGMNTVTVYVRESRYSKELIDQSDFFSLDFFDSSDKKNLSILKFLGSVSGRNEDKIAEARLHINHQTAIPYLDESNFVLLCRKLSATKLTKDQFLDPNIAEKWYADNDMHTMYIAEIKDILVR